MDAIKAAIAANPQQAISFAEFMQLALYHPTEGYYSQHVAIGKQGDFVTAPELSPLFAYGLAKQFCEIKQKINSPTSIIEFGAGNGTLAKQMLTHLNELDELPEYYHIIEVSGHLKAIQQQTIATLDPALQQRVRWHSTLPTEKINGMVIANEVLDAMPIHLINYQGNAWTEKKISFENNQFTWRSAPLSVELENYITHKFSDIDLSNLEQPYTTEVNLNYTPWIDSMSHLLNEGLCLLIDYGFSREEYYSSHRNKGTLMCHYQQKTHPDPFINIGKQDITAHVDFTTVAEAAVDLGFHVDGYSEQGHFLLSLDVLEKVETFEDKQAIKLLTLPHEMGALFKVIGLSKGESHEWQGFQFNDKRGRL